jgi:MYXO-CTERM domain-containing protein
MSALTRLAIVAGLGVPSLASAAPLFVEKTAQLGAQPCAAGDAGCYTNYAILADLDGDGALDIVLPSAKGYYVKEQPAEPLVILHNNGTASFSDDSSAVGGFSGWLREVAIGDVDGDGDLDIAAPDAWGGDAALFINDGTGQFIDQASFRWAAAPRAGSVRLADVDDDGDLDLFVGDWGADPDPGNPSASSVALWINDGNGVFAAAETELPAFPDGSTTPIDLDILDANGDFALDLLINARNGDVLLWLNDGAGGFSRAPLPTKTGPYSYNPGVCDVDGDGDVDVWVDNGFEVAYPQLLINDGAGAFADQTAERVPGSVQGQDDNGVICADVDGDGDFDAVVMSLGDGSSAANSERVLLNDGSGSFSLLSESFPLVADATLGMDMGDLDGDGRLDAVTGQGEFGDWTNRLYLGSAGVAADTRAPTLRAVEALPATVDASATTVVHFAIADEVTTDTGPRLAEVYVEWTGADDLQHVAARFSGADVYRAELPARGSAGAVSWRVCATDRAGNQACSEPKTYEAELEAEPAPPGGSDDPAEDEGCSCSSAGAGRGPAAWLGAASLLALVSRARRRWAKPRLPVKTRC